jgi:hypothetical protein
MSRREFMGATTAFAVGAGLLSSVRAAGASAEWPADYWDPLRPFQFTGKALRVQPVLMYNLPTPRPETSWKAWGGVQTPEAVAEEVARITRELADVAGRADFPVEMRPVIEVPDDASAAKSRESDADVVILYPATGSGTRLRACMPEHGGLIFVRHRSGPVYYWYEALSTRYLEPSEPGGAQADAGSARVASVHDVVVDDLDEVLWRLRALYAVRNFRGARVLALGGAAGKYAGDAPAVARERFNLDIVEVSYESFAPRIEAALADAKRMARAEAWTQAYLGMPDTRLQTERHFLVNAFALYGLFKDLMQEHGASIFTINSCMGTILPLSKTTACLSLSLLNDEGPLAFCESDFVIVPAGILMHYLSGKPVFLHNSTFPHDALVTCAHCTAPRRLDGSRYEPVTVMTHYESEFGAAPKVDMPVGQEVTCISPEYATGRWVGIRGTVEDNPNFPICRSQQDVRIHGDWRRLMNEARDSHWVMVYGEYLREAGYAARKLGLVWDPISEA